MVFPTQDPSRLLGLLRLPAGSFPLAPPGGQVPHHECHLGSPFHIMGITNAQVSLPSRILPSLHPHSDFQTEIHGNKAERKGKEKGKRACSPQGLKTPGATAARQKHSRDNQGQSEHPPTTAPGEPRDPRPLLSLNALAAPGDCKEERDRRYRLSSKRWPHN